MYYLYVNYSCLTKLCVFSTIMKRYTTPNYYYYMILICKYMVMLVYFFPFSLDHYGITGVANSLFKRYLIGRICPFPTENTWQSVFPQFLVCYIFLIYFNDLENTSSVLNIIRKADDTTLFRDLKSIPKANRQHCWLYRPTNFR